MIVAIGLLALLAAAAAEAPGTTPPEVSTVPSAPPPTGMVPVGEPLERLECAAAPGFSYALYLPRAYTPDRRWPILYCFDPSRRGMVPIELFREAAERHGWILASSNDFSSADSVARSGDAMVALWNDAIARFAIDPGRIYATGYSGGGRLAWLLDYYTRDVPFAGLIEVGAGLPWREWPKEWTPSDLVYYGLVGVHDFNFHEMEYLANQLEEKGIRQRLVSFEGAHAWPPPELCAEAIDWMEIEAMRAGTRAREDSLVQAVYARELAHAQADENADQPIEAFRTYYALARTFEPLTDITEARAGLDRLRTGGKLKERQRTRQREAEREAEDLAEATSILRGVADPEDPEPLPSPKELREKIGIGGLELRAAGADVEAAAAARRILEGIYVRAVSEMPRQLLTRAPARAARIYEIAVSVKPDRWEAWLGLARARAQAGWIREGLDALGRVASLCVERDALRADPLLEPLRREPRFEQVLAAPAAPATPPSH